MQACLGIFEIVGNQTVPPTTIWPSTQSLPSPYSDCRLFYDNNLPYYPRVRSVPGPTELAQDADVNLLIEFAVPTLAGNVVRTRYFTDEADRVKSDDVIGRLGLIAQYNLRDLFPGVNWRTQQGQWNYPIPSTPYPPFPSQNGPYFYFQFNKPPWNSDAILQDLLLLGQGAFTATIRANVNVPGAVSVQAAWLVISYTVLAGIPVPYGNIIGHCTLGRLGLFTNACIE